MSAGHKRSWHAAGTYIVQDDGTPVAQVIAYDTPTQSQLDDTRLIAAAPMLLEALEGMLSNCKHGAIEGITMWHQKAMPTDAQLDAARAAIAAAKGEA